MDVSIIIVNYKTPELVVDCLKSIEEKTRELSYEIIVVDNDSRDQSVAMLKNKLGSKITLVESEQNLGFGKANNLGAKYANGKYLFLLNSDTLLINNAIKILFEYLEKHEDTAVVGGNLYTLDMRPSPSHCTEFDDIESVKSEAKWNSIIQKLLMDRIVDKLFSEKKKEKFYYRKTFNFTDEVKTVAYIFGTDMMLRRKDFEEVKGFDPDFFMYAEEEELSWRITQKGYKIVNVPEAKIIHYDGASVKKVNSFSERQFKMRLNGTLTYYFKRFGNQGVQMYYKYKKLRFERQIKLAEILHKTRLVERSKQLMDCVKEVYEEFMKSEIVKGV